MSIINRETLLSSLLSGGLPIRSAIGTTTRGKKSLRWDNFDEYPELFDKEDADNEL